MDGHLEEGLHPGAAQVHGSIDQAVVHLLELGHHVQDHVGQIERDMGDQQRPEGQTVALAQQLGADEHEQQRQRHAGNNVRVRHGDIGQAHGRLAQPGIQAVDANRRHRTEGRGDQAGQDGHDQRVAQQLQQAVIPEEPGVLPEGEAVEMGDILAGVEGCHNQHRHGNIQENKNQDRDESVGASHTTTLPSSSPPKRFMMPVHTNTSSISTMDSTAPRLGLLPCLN